MPTCLVIGDSHVDAAGLAAPIKSELEKLGYKVTLAGVGATSARVWTDNNPVCRPKKDKCVNKSSLPHGVDLLVVSLGTNDAANASAAKVDKAKAADDTVQRILKLKDAFGAKKLLWVGPPWMGGSMQHYTNENMAFVYEAAAKANVPVFDSRPVTKKLRETSGSQDAVHLYGSKGKPWAQAAVASLTGEAPTPPTTTTLSAGIGWGVGVAVLLAGVFWLRASRGGAKS